MTVVAITDIKGNPQELLGKYDKVNAQLMQQDARAPGLQVHTCVVLDDGIRIANVFENQQQALDGFNRPEFQAALRDAGFTPIEPTIHRVHNHINFAAAQGAAR
jgi:hypothetical protein